MKILLIEDEIDAVETMRDLLKDLYIVEVGYSGEEGGFLAYANVYDVIIVDYYLPDKNGLDVVKEIREANIACPILMLSANSDVRNKIRALRIGVDDYVTKPYSREELKARIEALIRRSYAKQSSTLSVGDLIFDVVRRKVFRGGKYIQLNRKGLDVLEYLMRNAGITLSRSMIIEHVWESEVESDTNIVDVHIKYLRDRIDRSYQKKLIKTVRGYGYKIEAE